jgi:very-short-patch-repair endonuclease
VQNVVEDLFRSCGGYASTAAILRIITRQQLDGLVRRGELVRVWHGVYAMAEPDFLGRLRSLDTFIDQPAVACLGTAAKLYGFDTEGTQSTHILDPGARVRPTVGLTVHQRLGAPLQRFDGRLATAPAWTAIEVARQLRRPRALATLDAALHSGLCTPTELSAAADEQKGRRGIVAVRQLLPLADGRAESPMESEARLVMIDYGLPLPELQFEIQGPDESWRVDFAWPDHGVVAEYESVDWHAGRAAMLRDKARFAAIQHLGWTVIPIIVTDVRLHPARLAERIGDHLWRAAAG